MAIHCGKAGSNVNPNHELRFEADDLILVIAPIEYLTRLEAINRG